MSIYSDSFWAEEMGINLEDLQREDPLHPDQVRAKGKLAKKAAEYWARERFLARLEPQAPEAEYTPPKRKPYPQRSSKVRRYDFTDQQLEIARRSLSAGDSV